MIRSIIIDDETKARSALKQEIKFNCKNVEIIGEASNIEEGIEIIGDLQPQLIFLDIQLSDGTGFNLLEQLETYDFHVIFTTAYSQHALQAFKFDAIDYLLKPIDGEELSSAVDKVTRMGVTDTNDRLSNFLHNRTLDNSRKKIALHTADSVRLFELRTIVRCNSEGNYTYFHFEDGTNLLISRTMKGFEDLLIPYGFVRIHNSHIINLDHLLSYQNSDGGYVIMSDQTSLPVAQRRKPHLLQVLEDFNSIN